ncbi:hypothetical protein [Phytomonospora endophytica]|uniref:Uncharacterized protein n=1 Tax=Phytomonospora endophytica TaxID=714109 RepID=A0A841FIB3_9ACTN|nr:hypothetical protein [Phytomonospora endophytica]MBB6035604.1 hypothetical protein [Phytomonospora endophytica]GIG70033.1 hypothetical protein Pen01_63280 [Phytomonospora endophytica]
MPEHTVDFDEYDGTNAEEYGYEGDAAHSGEDISQAYAEAEDDAVNTW